jgi:hypothetical protein
MTQLIRIEAARAALARAAWARRQTPAYDEDAIIDLLADIRQWCAAAGLDFSHCNHIAWTVYQDENGGAA